MNDLSTRRPARLFTAFGTVVHVDAATGLLRHGPVESSAANVVFVADSSLGGSHRQGWLTYRSGARCEWIICLAERCYIASAAQVGDDPAQPTVLELIPLERGLITFKAGDLFLSAIPDGRVLLRAGACSTWELYLASEDWCSDIGSISNERSWQSAGAIFDKKRIVDYVVRPKLRVWANTKPKATKLLIYGYPQWSHGRVYYDLCKHLHRRGYIVDILNWQLNHSDYIGELIRYYDLFMTALDGVRTLVDSYRIPLDRIIAVSHGELDARMLIEQKGIEVFDKFANYGVVSESLYCASLMRGVARVPMVASVGINYSEFHAEIPERLATAGYASSMSLKTYGIEIKRGELAEAAARDAGVAFKVAGWTGDQTSFHDMPEFYRTVDALLASSISEAAPLPVMEAAAAGRLVISTPVGHFPLKAYQGGGIIAPVEVEKYKSFTTVTLRYYKDNPAAYVDKCRSIQEAAKQFDWQYSIDAWIQLIEAAKPAGNQTARPTKSAGGAARRAIICSIGWLSSYIAVEHYYLIKLLQEQHGFEIIDASTLDVSNPKVIRDLNKYDVLLVTYQHSLQLPLHLISSYKIFKVDDLVSYNCEYDKLVDYLIENSDMVISPYAYEFPNYHKHGNVVWVPYSSALEACRGHERILFNDDPIPKVLTSGSIAWDRPFRTYVVCLSNDNIEILPHPGYGGRFDDDSEAMVRTNYFCELNKYLCCFTDGHKYRYIHLKNFEIASVGSLLLTDKVVEKEMNELGFVDYDTCIFTDQETFLDKVSWILDPQNRARVNQIRRSGMQLVRQKHMTRHRAAQLTELLDNLDVSTVTRVDVLNGAD
jgi:glycosyltransferase involved in cell wall biosynthesis